jgi:hypothetical protein
MNIPDELWTELIFPEVGDCIFFINILMNGVKKRKMRKPQIGERIHTLGYKV